MDISARFGISAGVFHVPVREAFGPPFGRALGHFKNTKRSEWGTIRLSDADVVCLVNLKFLSAHHKSSPEAVIKLQRKADGFVKLHGRAKARRAKSEAR